MLLKILVTVALVPLATSSGAGQPPKPFAVENGTGLESVRVVPQTVTYRGRQALRLVQTPNATAEGVALVTGLEFKDGTIDADVAGLPGAGSSHTARGYVGFACRSAAQ